MVIFLKITFIFGNGFDLQMGLKTGYLNFLDWYARETEEDNEVIKDFKQYLRKKENRDLWSDAEIGMGQYLAKFSDADIDKYQSQIEDFELKIVDYLLEQQRLCSYTEKGKIKEIFSDFLFSSYKDVLNRRSGGLVPDSNRNNQYRFISFNYTDVLDKIVSCTAMSDTVLRQRGTGTASCADTYKKVYHVHGSLDSQIIMGVNEEQQLDCSGGIAPQDRLIRMLVKPILNAESGHNWDVPAKSEISSSDIIYIYGVSFGETDKLWWNEIRQWLSHDSNHKLVVFNHCNDENAYRPALPWSEKNYEEDKQREILIKLGVLESDPEFETLRGQLYIIQNTKRLNLKDILFTNEREAV